MSTHGTEPFFDDRHILYLLSLPPDHPDNLLQIQGGAVQALLNCWDRDVKRHEFVDMAAHILMLYGQAAKLSMLRSIQTVYQTGTLDDAKFIDARDKCMELIRDKQTLVSNIVSRVSECPTNEDVVH